MATVHRWTESAIDCYKRGGNCAGCPTQELMEQKCQMKQSVTELLQKFGEPPEEFPEFFPGITETENEIANAIINGANNSDEIATALKISRGTVAVRTQSLYKLAQENGLIFSKQKGRLNELVDFLRAKANITKDEDKNMIENELDLQNDEQNLQNDEQTLPENEQENIQNTHKRMGGRYFDEDLKLEYQKYFKEMIDAIKKGYETIHSITSVTGIKYKTIANYFNFLFKEFVKQGFLNQNTLKSKRQAVIDFIQSRLLDNSYKEKPATEVLKENAISQIENKNKICREGHHRTKTLYKLTETETTVQNLLLKGLNYKQIAEELVLSDKTVKTHVNAIFSKCNYHSLQDLLVAEFQKKNKALEERILSLEKEVSEKPEKTNTNVFEFGTLIASTEKQIQDFETQKAEIDEKLLKLKTKLQALEVLAKGEV